MRLTGMWKTPTKEDIIESWLSRIDELEKHKIEVEEELERINDILHIMNRLRKELKGMN